jgi:hypothetical protein
VNVTGNFRLAVSWHAVSTWLRNVRTLILILICAAFVAGGMLDATAEKKGRFHIIQTGVISLGLGVVTCWLLVYVIGIFDGWTFTLRR